MEKRIEQILEQSVRPKLALHGGGVELLSMEEGTVHIQLLGQCSNCPASYLTTEQLILTELKDAIPEIQSVVAEQGISEDLMAQAKKLMGRHHG